MRWKREMPLLTVCFHKIPDKDTSRQMLRAQMVSKRWYNDGKLKLHGKEDLGRIHKLTTRIMEIEQGFQLQIILLVY